MVRESKNIHSKGEPPPLGDAWWNAVLMDAENQDFSKTSQNHGKLTTESVAKSSFVHSEINWELAGRLYAQDQIVQLQVYGCNRGGLLVQGNGIQGFVPLSHVVDYSKNGDNRKPELALELYIGQELSLKVIECDQVRGRIVFSERAAQAMSGIRLKLLNQLEVGQVVEGCVTTITNFGVFIELGGLEGLIHISELSWGRVRHPRDLLKVGDFVKTYVLQVDRSRSRVALSIKRLYENPWDTVEEHYQPGQIIDAEITSIVSYGAFARLEEGLDGLIHISELGSDNDKPTNPREVLNIGQKVKVCILHVDPSRQRLGLSLYNDQEETL